MLPHTEPDRREHTAAGRQEQGYRPCGRGRAESGRRQEKQPQAQRRNQGGGHILQVLKVLLIIEVGAAMVRGGYHGQGKRDHARGKR